MVLAVGLLVVLAACGSSSSTGAPSSPAGKGATSPSPLTLAGTQWLVTGIKGTSTLTDHRPTMTFAGDTVSGSASCNHYSGSYSLNGSTLSIGQTATTAMMCLDKGQMSQESAFLSVLPSVARARSVNGGIELLDAQQQVVLTLAPATPVTNSPLEGTTWTLTALIDGDVVSSTVVGSSVTLLIRDGRLSGKACNSFNGTVATDGHSFKVGPLRSTRMACTNAGLTKQETAVVKVLENATGYTIEGSTLTITAVDGMGLIFTAA